MASKGRKPGEPLRSRKREAFCQAYAKDLKGNGTRAALKAGYSSRSAGQEASRLLCFDEIRARIDEIRDGLIANLPDDVDVSVDWVMAFLKDRAERSPNETVRVRAAELIGKQLRMFVEQYEELTPERQTTDDEIKAALLETIDASPRLREKVIHHLEEAGDVTRGRPRLAESAHLQPA